MESSTQIINTQAGVYGFVNFGHRPWWCRGQQEKICKKKLFPKEIILKSEKKPGWFKNTK